MLHGILIGASEWALFTRIDASIAEDFRRAGCARCGGRLHVADYARKPRGLGFNRGEGFTRFSFCCGSEGCRRRSTPPSVRDFGSRVYASGCFLVVSALSGGCRAAAARKLRRRLGIDRRTLRRWRRWWREAFPRTPQWIARRGEGDCREAFRLPERADFFWPRVRDWLAAERGLDGFLLDRCWRRGLAYADARMHAVFVCRCQTTTMMATSDNYHAAQLRGDLAVVFSGSRFLAGWRLVAGRSP